MFRVLKEWLVNAFRPNENIKPKSPAATEVEKNTWYISRVGNVFYLKEYGETIGVITEFEIIKTIWKIKVVLENNKVFYFHIDSYYMGVVKDETMIPVSSLKGYKRERENV